MANVEDEEFRRMDEGDYTIAAVQGMIFGPYFLLLGFAALVASRIVSGDALMEFAKKYVPGGGS